MNGNNQIESKSQQIQDEQLQSILNQGNQLNNNIANQYKEIIANPITIFFQQSMKRIDKILLILLVLWIALFLVYALASKNSPKCPQLSNRSSTAQKSRYKNDERQLNTNENIITGGDNNNSQEENGTFISNSKPSLGHLLKDVQEEEAQQKITGFLNEATPSWYLQQSQQTNGQQIYTINNSPSYLQMKKRLKQKYEKHEARGQKFIKWQQIAKFQNIQYARSNMQSPLFNTLKKQQLEDIEKQSLQKKYSFSQYPKQQSICTIVYSTPFTSKQFYHQYVLTSILHQKYENHKIVFIADGYSTDRIRQLKQLIQEKNVNHNIFLIWNENSRHFLQSLMIAIKNHCLNSDITALVRGTDQLLGKYVYKTINSMYRKFDSKIVYSNSIKYRPKVDRMQSGLSESYQYQQKIHNTYRKTYQKYGRLFTFWTKLFSFLKADELKDKNGYFYQQGGEDVLIYSLLQLSCGQVQFLPEYTYFQYDQQMDEASSKILRENLAQIKEKTAYSCFKKYE